MNKRDFRKLSPKTQSELRLVAVKAVEKGATQQDAANLVEVSRQIVCHWVKLYREGGEPALSGGQRGRRHGKNTRLSQVQCSQIQNGILDKTPEQLKFPFALWTRRSVQALIEKQFKLKLPLSTIGEYLRRWGLTAQRPKKQAIEQQPEAIQRWLKIEYPKIEKRAQRQKAAIHWGDETGVHTETNYGRSYSLKNQTPVIKRTTKRMKTNVISTVTNQGKLRFMLYDSNFNTEVFLLFLKRLIKGADKKIFLIVDNHRVHHTLRVQRWLKKHSSAIKIFYLPPLCSGV